MSKNDIISLKIIKGVQLKNTHNNFIFPKQYIIEVKYRNGKKRILDLFSMRDISSINYFKVLKDENIKERILFQECE